MRVFDRGQSEVLDEPPLSLVRWEQYGLDGRLPFGAMWYTVEPGTASPTDKHSESELSIVLSGTAHVEAGGQTQEVEAGNAFLLDGNEAHVIHNRSQDPLLIFSAYWEPTEAGADADA